MSQRSSESTSVTKTWGPFTGRQLTTVLCVLIVTVLFPVTSWAVTGSSVFLVDPHTGYHASIDSAGSVQVKVNGGVDVAPPSAFVESHEVLLTTSLAPILTPPAGKDLVVTTVTEDWSGDNLATASYAAITIGTAGTCASPSDALEYFLDLPTGAGNHDNHFTPGYVVPNGKSLCADQAGTSNPEIFLGAFGYTVPKGTVAAPHASIAGATPAARR
jgi:hypothetical protein